ncbi:MAG: hypothetical protein ACUVR4_09020 [Anaerolineae bacterium]
MWLKARLSDKPGFSEKPGLSEGLNSASGTVSGYPKNPNATGLTRLLTGLSADDARHLLKGQVVVASYDGGGNRVDATRAQIQSVLDALYAANAKTQTLGVAYSGGVPTVKVWAPTAKSVTLRRYADSTTTAYTSHPMSLDATSGVWSVTGDSSWDRQFYLFDVEVYVPSTDAVEHNLVTDPYSVSLSQDGAAAGDVRSQFVNLDDADLKPAGWDSLAKPPLAAPEDIVIYEVHIRPRVVYPAEPSGRGPAHRQLQLGLRPLPPRRARGFLQH